MCVQGCVCLCMCICVSVHACKLVLANDLKYKYLLVCVPINEAKTNMMSLNGTDPVRIDNNETELIPKFKYLGSVISMNRICARA